MQVKVVGFREVSYTNKDGRAVEGREFYVTMPKEGVFGEVAFSMFFSKGKYSHELKAGSVADVTFELGRDLKPYPKELLVYGK